MRNGERARGQLLAVGEPRYLLQTKDECLLLGTSDLRSIDGSPLPKAPGEGQALREMSTLEEVDAEGNVLLRSRVTVHATSGKLLTSVDWGLGTHEVAWLADYQVLDPFGRVLPYRAEDVPGGGKHVFVDLDRPLLPGEELELTVVIRQPRAVQRDGADWLYRQRGDYPDPRLVTRSVLLPAGAKVVSVTPAATQHAARDGRVVVIWRRYFVAGEEQPLEIRYRT
ncbi:MAG: hypothetical protein U0527_03210 [Candidatus Eisenbacteria bacterium]